MFRIHRGFFQTMGVSGWGRFDQLMYAIIDNQDAVRSYMHVHGALIARLLARALNGVTPDGIILSEPIGGNHGPLISPRMYEEVVLSSYEPILEIARNHGVDVVILRTYANARALIPSMFKWGIKCLWACECAQDSMDYRSLREEFGRDLRLIGGIDTDVLYLDKSAIRREVMDTVPQLVAEGGFVPLADGRVRKDVPFANYIYYRELLEEVTRPQ
jgi:uroporphyrinogen-III decarboxylase